jgi:transmembrane sensor
MNDMNEEIIIKYLQGQCSPAEEDLFLKWLKESSENKKFFYEQKALLNYRKVKHFGTDEQINQAAARFRSNVLLAESRRKKQVYLRFLRYAAVLVFLLAVPAILYKANYFSSDSKLITISIAQTDSSKFVLLSDGSSVWLNSNSSLTYPETFANGERNVQLAGEAYFEVSHDSLHPFKVQTQNIQVKVLGTSFNVRSYSSETNTETTLVEGKVLIQNEQGNSLATLAPGQMADYDKTSQYLAVRAVDPNGYTAWRHGLIVFTNAGLNDITEKLSELYQVYFIINGASAQHTTYNFSFRKGQSLDKVLEMLSFIAPIKYNVQGKEIFITVL